MPRPETRLAYPQCTENSRVTAVGHILGAMIALILCGLPVVLFAADESKKEKPIVAIFPISGDAKETARDRALALRMKLDRTENFTVLDGYKMKDLADQAKEPVGFDTSPDVLKMLAATEKPSILMWGDLNGTTLRIKILEFLKGAAAKPLEITKAINEPTDMRFAIEQVLEAIKDVKPFDHPNEVAVQHDAKADCALEEQSQSRRQRRF